MGRNGGGRIGWEVEEGAGQCGQREMRKIQEKKYRDGGAAGMMKEWQKKTKAVRYGGDKMEYGAKADL